MEERIRDAIEALVDLDDSGPCEDLIRMKGVKTPAIAEAALEAGIFYPPILYRYAAPETREKLIALLEQDNGGQANKYLVALAVIGDERVAECFKKWEEHPPAWREKLYVGPSVYALEGGWCLEDGKQKPLTFDTCYALEPVEDCLAETNVFGGTSTDKCPHCGSSYINMLVIDGRDQRLSFLGLRGRIKIKYCDCCLPWEAFLYCRYEEDGESTVIYHESGAGELCEDESLNRRKAFVLSQKPVPKDYCEEFDRCAVGGAPTFVDDANYAVCPNCGKRMRHLAQLGSDWTGCGTEYIQICTDCKIAAVNYQQT